MRTAIRLLSAACAGTALLACGSAGVVPPAPQSVALPAPAQEVAALEKACVLDPLDPMHWEHLAQALERQGQDARAALMRRQAQSLRDHDVQRDYALLADDSVAPATARALAARRRREVAPDGAPAAQADEPEGPQPRSPLARIEVVAVGGAMVLLRRVAAQASPGPVVASAKPAQPASASDGTPPVRLEISNGNGVNGMAAALARTMRGDDVTVVRLTNVRPFVVPVSRVEYRADQQAAAQALATRLGMTTTVTGEGQQRGDVRIVLGRDLLSAAVLRQRYLK